MRDITLNPVFPWPWLVLLAVLVMALIGWSLLNSLRSRRRAAVLWTFRGTALGALLLMLLQPQQRRDEVTALRPQLAVLVDTTESMTDPVDALQPLRADRVREWFQSPAFEEAKREFDVRLFTFDQSITKQPVKPEELKFAGERSNIFGALRETQKRFRGQPLAGILLLSDGLDTITKPSWEGEAPAEPRLAGRLALPSKAPVFALELEKAFKPKARPKQIAIINVDYPQRAVIGWETEVRVSLAGTGLAGQTVGLELWRNGQKRNETAVAFNEDDQVREAAFTISHDQPGMVEYELRLTDPAANKDSGEYPFLIEVIERGNRLLYVQNALGFDFKFLRKALTSDRNLQMVSYVRWADNRLVSLDDSGITARSTPLEFTQQSLAQFAVVMLGNLPADALTAADWRALREFVDRGGGLIVLGGANGMPTALGDLLPVKVDQPTEYREGNFPVEITDLGLRHPVFGPLLEKVKDFPPLLTCNIPGNADPIAEILMEANVGGRRVPLIASKRFGQGRVVGVLTDTIWRWRLAAKGWTAERSPYDTFWAQLMDWLIPKEQEQRLRNRIELFSERSNYQLGEKPDVRAIVSTESGDAKLPATLALQVRTPDDRSFDYLMRATTITTHAGRTVPGYRVEVEPHVAGLYQATARASLGGTNVEAQTRFVIIKPVTELTGKPINRELLQQAGKFYTLGRWNDWRKDLQYEKQTVARVQLDDVWNHPLLLAVLMLALAADWLCRKLWSLP